MLTAMKSSRRWLTLLPLLLALPAACMLAVPSSAFAQGGPPPHAGGPGGGGDDNGEDDDDGGDGEDAFPSYQLVDLGLDGRLRSLNDWGEMVGVVDHEAHYWHDDGEIVSTMFLPELDPDALVSRANDINNIGDAVGREDRPFGEFGSEEFALYWIVGDTVIELPNPKASDEHWTPSRANAVSDAGLIVGHYDSQDAGMGAGVLVWQVDENGQIHAIELAEGSFSLPSGNVNNLGEAIFNERLTTDDGTVFPQAVLWQLEFDSDGLVVGGEATDLPSLGGLSSSAFAIDDFGNIGGEAQVDDEVSHAVLWYIDEAGNVVDMTDLGTLDNRDTTAQVLDFNTDGDGQVLQVVGRSGRMKRGNKGFEEFVSAPFMWHDGEMVDLNELVNEWNGFKELLSVVAINQDGWVCGIGEKDGNVHSYLAVPIEN